MSAQSDKALLSAAGMLMDSARNMEIVVDKLESIATQQAAIFDRLSDQLDSMGKSGGKGAAKSEGVKGFGEGVKDMASGLAELSKILPSLIKGLIGFNMAKSDTFVGFVRGLTEAIGKESADVKTQYADFSKAITAMSEGLTRMSIGLFMFDKLTSDDGNKRFIEFIRDITKLKLKKVQEGADALGSMAKSVATFGLAVALSAPVYAIAAVGSLIIVPMIAGYAYLFAQLGEKEVSDKVDSGAKAVAWMGIGIISFALGIFAVKELAGGNWGEFALGSLAVITGMTIFAGVFYLLGGKEFSERVRRGSESLILSGVAIASVAVGIWVFQQMDIGLESVLMAGLAVAVTGLAFGLAGKFAGDIALGALALIGASIAVIAIGFGFQMFKKNDISLEDIGLVSGVLVAVGVAMAAAGLASVFIIPGAAALAFAGLSLYSVTKGLNVFKTVKFGEEDADKLNYVIQSIASSFALAGGTSGMSSLFGINIGRNSVERGVDSVMYAGDALTNITKGLMAFKNLGIDEDEMKSLWNSISFVVTGISSAFSVMGGDPGERGGLLGLLGIEKPTNVERGISSVKDIGSTLVDLAEGVKAFANLTFKDPITGKTIQMTNKDIEMVGTNIAIVLGAVSSAFGSIGAGSKPSGGVLGFFGATDNAVAQGISAVKGVGRELVNLAEGVRAFASLSFKDPKSGKVIKINPADLKYDKDPRKSGAIIRNIVDVVSTVSKIFGEIGSQKGESTGFFGMFGAKSNTVAEGIEAVKGVGTELSKIAESVQIFAKIDNLEKIKSNIISMITSLPSGFVVAYTKYFSKLPEGWMDKIKPFNKVLEGFIDSVKDAPLDTDKKGKSVISFIEHLAKSADPITKLASSFDKVAKSMDRFVSSLRKMNPEAAKTSAMLIQSLVTFSNVDPSALDKNTNKGRDLINFIYEKKEKPESKAPATPPTPSIVTHAEPGKKPVKAEPKPAEKSAAAQANLQLTQMMTDMTTNMGNMANALKDIKMILQGTLKVQQV